MKRIWLVLAVLMILPALVFARGSNQQSASGGGYIRHAWWGNPTRDERTIAVAKLFMEKNPGVTVETEPSGWDDYWPKLNTQVAGGSLPDVMQQDYQYIEQYNSRNLLVDLNTYAGPGKPIDLSRWSDAGLAGGRLGGKLIALNIGTNALGMVVDPAVLRQAGVSIDDTAWTWADFERISLAIFRATGVQTSVARDHAHIQWEHIVRQAGVPFFAPGGKSLGFTNNAQAKAALVANLEMYARLRQAGALFDPSVTFTAGITMPEEPLTKKTAWNAFYWSNQVVGFRNAAGREMDYYILPSVSGSKAPFGTYLKPGQFIAMVASSKSQDLAAKYINFFVNDIEANRILLAERGIPIPSNVQADLAGRVDAVNKSVFDYIAKVTPFTTPIDPPDPAATGEVRDVMRPILLSCLQGNIAPAVAVDQMIAAANAVLSR